jgi:hypothetical protein
MVRVDVKLTIVMVLWGKIPTRLARASALCVSCYEIQTKSHGRHISTEVFRNDKMYSGDHCHPLMYTTILYAKLDRHCIIEHIIIETICETNIK